MGQQEMPTELWAVNPKKFRRRWEKNIEVGVREVIAPD
jgi:hypothetical protein